MSSTAGEEYDIERPLPPIGLCPEAVVTVERAYREFRKRRPEDRAAFLVLDARTYQQLNFEGVEMLKTAEAKERARRVGLTHIYGMAIVVIPTDGLPMIKIVSEPFIEHERELRYAM